ncbi:Vacuolar fusion protein CCZ1 like [Trichophyton interdigitale]|uniref:Vacuolar fusion protein CCZ1 like n=1 Tax=Trichophyton interdigitale TaxID=101480 RepID=A0A9P4YIE3_9EURO|nr:Vacuolar fusion protein CCZ1 like [Trichophyton interdigitale]KAG5205969.1 Vacuolar fusion protein CCZ1 like [Trichophyton interdigitale]KAG8205493.1 Vacuolar fusion protein CCZ1 like [Trichophyton interdigitale]
MPPLEPPSVIPAQLSFLTIYNPSLGTTDETLQDQIVFYYSTPSQTKPPEDVLERDTARTDSSEEENKRLRHVGLAQGMVSFAKNFSSGEPVDSIETENSRIVLKELEPGWWILASIDLTKIIHAQKGSTSSKEDTSNDIQVEYSSRELSPPYLLSQQLSKAYSIFLLHHGSSLESLYKTLSRKTFCIYLDRYWTRFVWSWDVLLNGNPAIDLFSATKLAGGGELGIGVGEEEWGSGEREVLEGFISRTEGLVDMVVSRFGDAENPSREETPSKKEPVKSNKQDWTGCMMSPGPQDGVIFSGIGALSRESLTHVSQWMEWVYRYGEDAYGVRGDPKSTHRRKRRKQRKEKHPKNSQLEANTSPVTMKQQHGPSIQPTEFSPRIPPPLVVTSTKSKVSETSLKSPKAPSDKAADSSTFGTENILNIITLGYGSTWGATSDSPSLSTGTSPSQPQNIPKTLVSTPQQKQSGRAGESTGRFLIGLRDDLENEESDSENIYEGNSTVEPTKQVTSGKIVVRKLEVTVQSSSSHEDFSPTLAPKSLQVVIYLYQPFIFTFLFECDTKALSSASFYRTIHHQIGPLQKPLLSSTSPSKVVERLSRYDLHQFPRGQGRSSPDETLYDIIYEPFHQTIRTSLPNIPEPEIPSDQIRAYNSPRDISHLPPWTRADALNVYTQIINTYLETKPQSSELERICKTNRGWWVLWMRLPTPPDLPCPHATSSNGDKSSSGDAQSQATAGISSRHLESRMSREGHFEPTANVAFLVRRASDSKQSGRGHIRSQSGPGFFRSIGGRFGRELEGWSGTPGRLVEGVGLDAKKYIDALINLNR